MGRPRKPTILKLRDGDDKINPSRINRREPEPPVICSDPEDWMDDMEKAMWKQSISLLSPCGMIAESDRKMLALTVKTWCDWRRVQAMVDKYGAVINVNGVLKRSPYAIEAHDLANRLRVLLSSMGMTPAARSAIVAHGPSVANKDAFAEMFRRQYGS